MSKPTKILRVDAVNPDIGVLAEAAGFIKGGGLVVFPTETVYGLGADALNRAAVAKIFEAKGRPLDNPLIIHIAETSQLEYLTPHAGEEVFRLAEKFWPGPLTLVLRRSDRVPSEVCAGLDTVAVRMPAHPVALKLIELSGTPIAAPSANPSGKPSPTSGEHVIRDMTGKVDLIIDAGETLYGVESTIIDVTRDPPVLLRPGALQVEEIEAVTGGRVVVPDFARGKAEVSEAIAPGMKYRHYAPSKPLQVIESENYADLEKYAQGVLKHVGEMRSKGVRVVLLASTETLRYYSGVETLELGSRKNLFEIARNLYKLLRKIDELDVDMAVTEGFEERGLGLTIMNRLRKASGFKIIK